MEIVNAETETTGTATESAENGSTGGGDDAAAAQLLRQFETFTEEMGTRISGLESRIPEPQEVEDDDDEFEDFDLDPSDFSDDDYDSRGNLTPEAQQRALVQMMRRVVQAEMAPEQERREQERREAQADALEEKYPALRDEKVQDEIIGKVQAFAQQLGQPELAKEPALVEMIYLAEEARKQAEDAIPAGSTRQVRLETGSTAPPAQQTGGGPDAGDRIVGLAQKRHHRVGG